MMDAISYTTARNNLAKTIDKVNDDHAPIIITRQKGKSAVLISLDDYNAFEETAYLMRNPKNAERLLKAIQDVEKGDYRERGLIEDED
jgi:antitoxin YefM